MTPGWISSRTPGRVAVRHGDDRITYARLSADVSDMAAWLHGQGLKKGDRVGIPLRHTYWVWIAHLGAMQIGCTVATLTQDQRDEIAASGGLDIFLGADAEPPAGLRNVHFAPKTMAPLSTQLGIPQGDDASGRQGGSGARLNFTSGTTGKRKAVFWSNEVLNRRVEHLRIGDNLGADTVHMTMLAMDTTAGFRYPLAVWRAGGSVMMRPLDFKTGWMVTQPSVLVATNHLATSPQHMQNAVYAVRKTWPGFDHRRIVIVGGRLPVDVRNLALRIAGHSVSIAYGATETGRVTLGDSSILDRHPGAVGFVLPEAEVEIVDERGVRKPAGETGIVRTRTDNMVHTYSGPGEGAGDNPFRDGWFYPGDEGIMFADGLLAITGRLSDTLNLMGQKVSTPEFEEKLSGLPFVREIAAVMTRGPKGDVLVVAVTCEDRVDPKELWQQLRERVPAAVPFELVRVKEIPRNSMGKIERAQLKKELTKLL